MSDLVSFLNARLDEDEATANAAMPGPWLHMNLGSEGCVVVRRQLAREGRPYRVYFRSNDLSVDHATAEHVARNDPARVLREVDAKRKILARIERDSASIPFGHRFDFAQMTLSALAGVYSDHPDFREEWKP